MKTSTLLKEIETGFDEARLKSWPVPDMRQAYDDRDTMLYALSVGAGLGRDDELRFVFENGVTELAALPTMAVIIETPGRSEERRVGKECVSPCRYRWSPYH